MCSKSTKTEAVFTKIQNEQWMKWKIFFKLWSVFKKYQNWSCIYQDTKWTMNETLIFFKIQGVFKTYQDWSCIYQDKNEQWMTLAFNTIFKQVFHWWKHFWNSILDRQWRYTNIFLLMYTDTPKFYPWDELSVKEKKKKKKKQTKKKKHTASRV